MSREEKKYLIEVNVAGVCFRETENKIEVLIAKRRNDRELYPGKWDCGGGQVYAGENFEEAIRRQMTDELGVLLKKTIVFRTYEIPLPNSPQKKIPGLRFICFFDEYANGQGPQINPKEYSEWKWQPIDDLGEIDFIDGLQKEIRAGWDFFNSCKSAFRR